MQGGRPRPRGYLCPGWTYSPPAACGAGPAAPSASQCGPGPHSRQSVAAASVCPASSNSSTSCRLAQGCVFVMVAASRHWPFLTSLRDEASRGQARRATMGCLLSWRTQAGALVLLLLFRLLLLPLLLLLLLLVLLFLLLLLARAASSLSRPPRDSAGGGAVGQQAMQSSTHCAAHLARVLRLWSILASGNSSSSCSTCA